MTGSTLARADAWIGHDLGRRERLGRQHAEALLGDLHHIHVDAEAAAAIGRPRPILHSGFAGVPS